MLLSMIYIRQLQARRNQEGGGAENFNLSQIETNSEKVENCKKNH